MYIKNAIVTSRLCIICKFTLPAAMEGYYQLTKTKSASTLNKLNAFILENCHAKI